MDQILNHGKYKAPVFESIALRGVAVFDTLNAVSKMCVVKLLKDIKPRE